jgi:ornithine cyclodeaminase/alanine dehydrogenase
MSVLKMKDCMEVVEKAFVEFTRGTADLPLRVNIKPPDGLSLYMPAYLKELGSLACKVVTVYKNNPSKYNLPVITGKVLLQDPNTGDVICIMDGGYLTAVRTGAASGVASKYLARDEQNMVVGIFGAGVQAKTQLIAMAAARHISRAYIFDTSDEAAQHLVTDLGAELDFDIIKADSPNQLMEADIICTATSSPDPLFDGEAIKPGTHINGIGSHTPNTRELDTAIIRRSKLVGDSREACFNEAGDVMIPLQDGSIDESHFYAELGEVITGIKTGRTDETEITVFKSNGLAIQDAATAKLVYDKAVEAGIGSRVEL